MGKISKDKSTCIYTIIQIKEILFTFNYQQITRILITGIIGINSQQSSYKKAQSEKLGPRKLLMNQDQHKITKNSLILILNLGKYGNEPN